MRFVVLSYSHHGRGIGRALRDLGHQIVGVMDPEEGPRQALSAERKERSESLAAGLCRCPAGFAEHL